LSADDNLADVFAWREERTVSSNLTLQYDKVVFLLEPNEITRELRRKRVHRGHPPVVAKSGDLENQFATDSPLEGDDSNPRSPAR
jgi:hypothetical protein